MNDARPSIVYDLGLGEFLHDISLNADAIADYMHRRGFTDEQIASIKIIVSHDDPEEKNTEDEEAFVTYGRAFTSKMEIELFPKAILSLAKAGQRSENEATRALFSSETEVNIFASERFSGTIAHELEHLKIEIEGGIHSTTVNGGVAQNVLPDTDDRHEAYSRQADELRCTQAAENAPKNFISIGYKISSTGSVAKNET